MANLTLPSIENLQAGTQPWVYFGFDDPNYISGVGVEAGYSYQTGTQRWIPFIKGRGSYGYNTSLPNYDGDTINNLKLFLDKVFVDDLTYTAFLVVGSTYAVAHGTYVDSYIHTDLSVKRNTTIASNFTFDGNNINTRSRNQRWANVTVKRVNTSNYVSWSNFSEYSEFKSGKWYGTIDCTSNYIHRSGSYTSIYK